MRAGTGRTRVKPVIDRTPRGYRSFQLGRTGATSGDKPPRLAAAAIDSMIRLLSPWRFRSSATSAQRPLRAG
jgi:hypothetical protein